MKILVTGATGFIGSALVPLLVKQGHEVIATYRTERKAVLADSSNVDWKRLDVSSPPDNPYVALGCPDRMVHLAWSGLPNYKDSFHLTENLPADEAFLLSMLRGGLGHLLVTGTCFEYGLQEGELREDAPCIPDNPYGQAKNILRQRLESAVADMGGVFQWARLFYIYGPGQSERSLFAQLERALLDGAESFDMSGGQQVRDYLPVDVVAEYLSAIVSQETIQGAINVCSGRNISLVELVRKYLAARGANIRLNLGKYPYPDWEPFRFWGSTGKLHRIIDLT